MKHRPKERRSLGGRLGDELSAQRGSVARSGFEETCDGSCHPRCPVTHSAIVVVVTVILLGVGAAVMTSRRAPDQAGEAAPSTGARWQLQPQP